MLFQTVTSVSYTHLVLEFFRGDPRGNVGALSTSQFIAIFMLIAGIAIFVGCGRKKDSEAEAAAEAADGEEENASAEQEPEEETEK